MRSTGETRHLHFHRFGHHQSGRRQSAARRYPHHGGDELAGDCRRVDDPPADRRNPAGWEIHQATGGCVGSGAIAQIQEMLFGQVFIGGCAMDADVGLTGFDFADCEFKKAVLKQSSQTVVALTADKLPGVARYVVARPQDLDVIIVEANTSDVLRSALQAQQITVITA